MVAGVSPLMPVENAPDWPPKEIALFQLPGVVPPSLVQLGSGTWDPLVGVRWDGAWGDVATWLGGTALVPLGESDAGPPSFTQRVAALQSFSRELALSVQAFHEGTDALRAGKCDDAIAALEYFVAEFPSNVSGRVNLGSSYLSRFRENTGTPLGLAEVLPLLTHPGISLRGAGDRVDLQKAREAGAITDAEFVALKAKIMTMIDSIEVVDAVNKYTPDELSDDDDD